MKRSKIMKLKQEMALADLHGDWERCNALWEEIAILTEKVIDTITWDGNNTEDVKNFVYKYMRTEGVSEHVHGYYHQRCLSFDPFDRRCVPFCVFVNIPVIYADCCFGERLRIAHKPDIVKEE